MMAHVPGANKKGFTLIELVIGMAVFGMVLTGVVKLFTGTGNYHTTQEMMVTLSQNIRSAKHLMTYEIRESGCDPKGIRAFGLQLDGDDRFDTDTDSIRFLSDTDNGDGDANLEPDGLATAANEDVAYYRVDSNGNLLPANNPTPGTLVRRVPDGTANGIQQQIVGDITNLAFTYFDRNNNVVNVFNNTNSLKSIRSVQVVLTGQVENPDRVREGNKTWTQQFNIRLRNS